MSAEKEFTIKRLLFNNAWALILSVFIAIQFFTKSDVTNALKGKYTAEDISSIEMDIGSIEKDVKAINSKIENDLATKEDIKNLEDSISSNTEDIQAIEVSRAEDIAEIKALISISTKQQDKILEIIQMQEQRTIKFFQDYELKKKEN